MAVVSAEILVRRDGSTQSITAPKMRFSPHRCFAYDGGDDDIRCLDALAGYLNGRKGPLAFYGAGRFCDYLLSHSCELAAKITCVLEDDPSRIGGQIRGIPIVAPAQLPPETSLLFLAETRTLTRLRMQKRMGRRTEIVTPEILAQLAWQAIPDRAWITCQDTIYPIDVPEIEFLPGQDMILLDCPARNLALMPNGLAYVHNAIKKLGIRSQTLDLDIITYHRYHVYRLFDAPDEIVTASGHRMPPDPWAIEGYEEWQNPDVIEHFRPEIDETIEKLCLARPKILGLSLQACNVRFAREIVKGIKARSPETVVLVGGYSCYQASVGRNAFPECDYMVIGEADLTVGPLVAALVAGERPTGLPGVMSRYDPPGQAFVPGPWPEDLDRLDMAQYDWASSDLYRNWNGYQLTPIIASRGCRWSCCTFCGERFAWRARSPRNVVDEFEWLYLRGCRLFMFNESDLNGKPDILLEICREIIRRRLKLTLTGQLRIHKDSDRAFFDCLRAAGFVSLRFGIDAWSRNTLRLQRKGYTTTMISRNLRDCREAGIFTEVNTVVGVPGETEEDIEESIALMVANKPYISRHANINPLMLFAGSVYWESPEEFGIVFRGRKEEIYADHPVIIPEDLWHSENPYIDAAVRKRRFEKIVRALHENSFNIGEFAERVIADMEAGKGAAQSARPEQAAPSCGERGGGVAAADARERPETVVSPSPQSTGSSEGPPGQTTRRTYRILKYRDEFLAVSSDLWEEYREVPREMTVRKMTRLELSARILLQEGRALLGDRRRVLELITRGLRVLRRDGWRGLAARVRQQIKQRTRQEKFIVGGS